MTSKVAFLHVSRLQGIEMLIRCTSRIEMIRDVEELPVILSELEESVGHIESSKYVLLCAKAAFFLSIKT